MNAEVAMGSYAMADKPLIASARKNAQEYPEMTMLNFLKMTALSAMVCLGGVSAMPAMASADNLRIDLGGNGVISVQHRPGGMRRIGCTAGEAIRKAERMGLRRAYIRSHNRNVVRVSGRVRGGRDTITFANARGCPVIRR